MVEAEIQSTVDRFSSELCDPQQLADTKSNLKYGFLMGLETGQNIAFSLIQVVINTGGIEAIEDYYETLDSITPEELREAARQIVRDEGRTIVVLSQKGATS